DSQYSVMDILYLTYPSRWEERKMTPLDRLIGRKPVLRIDGAYLYRVGWQIHQLETLRWEEVSDDGKGTNYLDALLVMLVAEGALETLLNNSVFTPRTAHSSGAALLTAIRTLKEVLLQDEKKHKNLVFADMYPIKTALQNFEAVLGAELALSPLY